MQKNKILIIIFGIIFVSGFSGATYAVAADEYVDVPSPREQLENGIEPEDIACKMGHVLALRPNDTPACVTKQTAGKLEWKIINSSFSCSECKGNHQEEYENATSDKQEYATIHNPEPEFNDQFGSSISIGDGVLAVGVPADGMYDEGSVYVYDLPSLHLREVIHNPEPESGDFFGSAVAIGDGILAVGAEGNRPHVQHIRSSEMMTVGNIQWLQNTFLETELGVVQVIDPDMNLDSRYVDNFNVDVLSPSMRMHLTVTETGKATGVFEGTVFFTQNYGQTGHRLRAIAGDAITAVYKDNTLPYSNTEMDKLDLVAKSTIGQAYKSSFDTDASSEMNIGIIRWMQDAYLFGGYGVVQVIDPDMNQDHNSIESFEISEISVKSPSHIIVAMTVTETGKATGVFESTVFFTPSYEMGYNQLQVTEGDTVTATYNDKTLPHSIGRGDMNLAAKSRIFDLEDFPSDMDVLSEMNVSTEMNVGSIQWMQGNYSPGGAYTVQVVDPDRDIDPNLVDHFDIEVWSKPSDHRIDLTVTETGKATGIFEGTVFFTSYYEDNDNRLRAVEGDTVTASYKDNTLPYPYTKTGKFELEIAAKSIIGPIHKAPSQVGSVYLYDIDSGELIDVIHNSEYDFRGGFGGSLSIDEGILTVRTTGTVPAYAYYVDTGERIQIESDPSAAPYQRYSGRNVATGEGVLAVGKSHIGGDDMYYSGAVSLYEMATENQTSTIPNPEPQKYDQFGATVAIGEGFLAVGTPGNDSGNMHDTGSVYLYKIQEYLEP